MSKTKTNNQDVQGNEIGNTSTFGKKTKIFWLFYILGAIGIFLGIALLPVWANSNVFWKDWGRGSVTIVLICMSTIYLVFYLVRKIIKETVKPLKILTIIESVIILAVIVLCFLEQFKVIDFMGPCRVFGIAFWLRGVHYIVKAYLYQHKKKEKPYPVYILIIAILLVSAGAFFVSNTIQGSGFLWLISIGMLLASVFSVVYGFIVIPKSSESTAPSKPQSSTNTTAKKQAKEPMKNTQPKNKQPQDPTFEDEMGIK